MKVIDKFNGKQLSNQEILEEANQKISYDFQNYDENDLINIPEEVLGWIDSFYYEITL